MPHCLTRLLRLLPFALLALVAARAADPRILSAVTAADDERLAATIAADQARLDAVYSDDLRYAHSSGKIDTKASQIAALVSGASKYDRFEHLERNFVPAGPGVVLMNGRALVHIRTADGQPSVLDLNYLAVWREENGKWRFLAWQSCRNPPATTR